MKPEMRVRLRRIAVLVSRAFVGLTFVISGWAKAIDPFGFIIKVGEYLSVWNMDVPHEAIVASCIALACLEFAIGALILVGSLRRVSVVGATTLMAFMLPLTLYIALANPVADCGCFGDFLIISNWATFAKNIVLTALCIYLLINNHRVKGLYPAPIQWMVITVSLAFPLCLSMAGYQIQPLVDFRPYKAGTEIFASASSEISANEEYIYEKDGIQRNFTLDEIPDSTWTFVDVAGGVEDGNQFDSGISVYDFDDNEVNAEIVSPDSWQLFLIIPEPGMHYLSYAHYINRLNEYCQEHGIEFLAVVGNDQKRIDKWIDWCRPDFAAYKADHTSLKQLVRGAEALVLTDGGKIVWKRTLGSMPPELPSGKSYALKDLRAPDDGFYHTWIVAIYIGFMVLFYILGLSPKILRFFMRRSS